MPGSWPQKREDGKTSFRIGGGEHVEIIFRNPRPPCKTVKSPDIMRIANKGSEEDGVKDVLLQSRNPGSKERNFELHGKQVGAQHVRRKPQLQTKYEITVLHELVHRRKIKVPKLLNDFPSDGVKSSILWGNLKSRTSENQHLCGSKIQRAYLLYFRRMHNGNYLQQLHC